MGGFERDLREKMFAGLPHLEILLHSPEGQMETQKTHDSTKNLYDKITDIPGLRIHSHWTHNIGNTLTFSIARKESSELLINFENAKIAVSAGSACSSGDPTPSRALKAIGCSDFDAQHAIRISLGKGILAKDVERIEGVIRKISN
jgi:cysteine desulfurase